jgi:DNA-binding MarR family transcriptional regulator
VAAAPEDLLEDGEALAVARFRLALRRFERRTDWLVRQCGLTPQRYLLLLAVRAAQATTGHATVSAIVRDLGMPQTTVTDLVARAVDAGLLDRRTATNDARVGQITLTVEGEHRLACSIRRLGSERADLRRALIEASRLFPT